jgi:hypothetical protein
MKFPCSSGKSHKPLKVMDIALRSVSPEHLYLSKNSPGNTGDEFVTHVILKEGIGRE